MEFTHGRRERFFVSTRQEEQQVQVAGGGAPLLMVSSPSSSSNLRGGNWMVPEREQMFEKVVTPSDVGKLNRLVIPKQHAERYFPMDAAADGGKGLLLSFEDRTGKAWRFRYSYWNSSQSYVMTKGWSRFVKEKRLDAGDTVCFSRGGGDRLFIDWKKRRVRDPFTVAAAASRGARINLPFTGFSFGQPPMVGPWGTTYPSFLAPSAAAPAPGSQIVFFQAPPPVEGRPADVSVVLDSTPSSGSRQAAAKGLRLFGVNLFCSGSEGGRETQVSSSPASVSKEHKHSSSLNLDL